MAITAGAGVILISLVRKPALKNLQGQTMDVIAKKWGKDPIDAIFDLLIQDPTTEIVGLQHVGT